MSSPHATAGRQAVGTSPREPDALVPGSPEALRQLAAHNAHRAERESRNPAEPLDPTALWQALTLANLQRIDQTLLEIRDLLAAEPVPK
jgi:hypothetical protein